MEDSGRLEDANKPYLSAIKQRPDDWWFHQWYAQFLESQNRLLYAAEYYREAHKIAIKLGRENEMPYRGSHWCHLVVVKRHVAVIKRNDNLEKAEKHYSGLCDEYPKEWWPRLWHGQIRLALSNGLNGGLAFKPYREAAYL